MRLWKYWKCRHRPGCAARLTTVNTGRNFIIRRGGSAADHKTHGPDPEEVEALRIQGNINVMLSPPFFYNYLNTLRKFKFQHLNLTVNMHTATRSRTSWVPTYFRTARNTRCS